MPYKTLSKLFYADASTNRFESNATLAKQRRDAESTFKTGISQGEDEFFLAVPRELSVLNETVLRQERSVSIALANLPRIARGALIRSLVIDEVVCTNDLEGIHSTRRQISDLLEPNSSTTKDLGKKRFRELARLYLELSDRNHILPATPEDIRSIYDQIMTGEELGNDMPDGTLFRSGGVDIIGNGGRVLHSGLSPESAIVSAVGRMTALATSPHIPETYSAILSHFLFEYIHPFYDGNGRTGRYLLALYLSQPLSTITALSLSRTIAENKNPYYRAFKDAEDPLNHGELTHFVITMLGYVSSSQQRILDDLQEKRVRLDAVEESLDRAAEQLGPAEKEIAVLWLLAQYALFGAFPDVPTELVSDFLELKQQMTRKWLSRLEERGLVKCVNTRPLRFILSEKGRELLDI